jgi:hypothetical protein
MAIPGVTPANQPGTGDYYIAQTDETPVREVVALTMSIADPGSKSGRVTIVQNSTQDYSRYGETFQVQVPKVCRSTRVTSASSSTRALRSSALRRAAYMAMSRAPWQALRPRVSPGVSRAP